MMSYLHFAPECVCGSSAPAIRLLTQYVEIIEQTKAEHRSQLDCSGCTSVETSSRRDDVLLVLVASCNANHHGGRTRDPHAFPEAFMRERKLHSPSAV